MKKERKKAPFWDQDAPKVSKKETDTHENGNIPFSKEHLYNIIKEANHPMRLDDVLRRSHITRQSKKEVLALLLELTQSGQLTRLRGGAYVVATLLVNIQGRLAIQRSGAAFVSPIVNNDGNDQKAGSKQNDRENDIFIPQNAINGAWNGDIVEVRIFPQSQNNFKNAPKKLKREGEVVRVVTRTQTEIAVYIERAVEPWQMKFVKDISDQAFLARPTDSRLSFSVIVPNTLTTAITTNDLCLVRIKNELPSSQDDPLWLCEPLEILGFEKNVSVQEHLTKINHGIPTSFPDDVEEEAKTLAKEQGFFSENGLDYTSSDADTVLDKNDTDLRSFNLVTIDGADARDFDDAIYVKRNPEGYQLIVAIADVSRFVTPFSKMDTEARQRANSYYFPNSVEPMLPEALSNGICSLRPNENHRVMYADMQFNITGQRIKNSFGQGVMRSKARLTYDNVQEYYTKRDSEIIPHEILPMLDNAKDLAQLLIKNRLNAGSLHLELPEPICIVEDNMVKGMTTRAHFFAHELIEAFMVSANEAVAEFLSDSPCLYRVHPSPAPERMQSLAEGLRLTAHQDILPAQTPQKMGSSIWISHVLSALKNAQKKNDNEEISQGNTRKNDTATKEKISKDNVTKEHTNNNDTPPKNASYLVHRLILRSMMQARYTPALDIHFGLASQCYCHFTSPIRRYADLIVHRSLKMRLKFTPKQTKAFNEEALTQTADMCNERERIAQTAEREIYRRMACLLLASHEGEEFDAIISGVSNYGVFAELTENMAEGMIAMDDLGDDYFIFEEESQSLYGSRTNVQYRLGDNLRVKLLSVSLGRLEIKLAPVGVTPRPEYSNKRAKTRNSPPDKNGSRSGKSDSRSGKNDPRSSKNASGKSDSRSAKSNTRSKKKK